MKEEKAKKVASQLRKLARENTSLTINDLRVVFALERIVARVESNPILAKHLIFKGGFVMLKSIGSSRFTRDIDALAKDVSIEDLKKFIETALLTDLDDSLWYGDIKKRSR